MTAGAALLARADAGDDRALRELLHLAARPAPARLTGDPLSDRAALALAGVGWVDVDLGPDGAPDGPARAVARDRIDPEVAPVDGDPRPAVDRANPHRTGGVRVAYDPLFHTVEVLGTARSAPDRGPFLGAPAFWGLAARDGGAAHALQDLRRRANRRLVRGGSPVALGTSSPDRSP